MIDLGAMLESYLRQADAADIMNGFLYLLAGVFLVSLVQARRGKWNGFLNYTPNLLTSLGILGTFIGIVVGLLAFDTADIDGSMGPLLEGLKTAFITSLAGMLLVILFKAADSSGRLRHVRGDTEVIGDVGPEDILASLRQQEKAMERLTQAIAGEEDSTLITQIRLLRSDHRDHAQQVLVEAKKQSQAQEQLSQLLQQQREEFGRLTEELWRRMEQFAEMMSKSATEQVINALREVIADFNKNLTEQFGENFKALDASVQKLVEWQENYRQQLDQMIEQYQQGVQAITDTRDAVSHISEESRQIPVTMGELKVLLETTRHQLDELARHLEAFKDMRDRAVEAVPQVQKQVDTIVQDIADASKSAGERLSGAGEQMQKILITGMEDFQNNVHRTNEGLTSASDTLANKSTEIRDQLDDTLKDINEGVRNMIKTLVDESGAISRTLQQGNEQLVTRTRETHDQVVQSIESMQKRLQSVLEEIFRQQANATNSAFEAVKKNLSETVGKTGEAVNKQLDMIDQSMQREVERVMTEMGKALAAISGRFTEYYQQVTR